MITITTLKSATKEFFKILRYGKDDVITADNCTPFGIDSKPIPGTKIIHLNTNAKGEGVAIGLLYKSDKTKEGETRIYATDSDGNEVFDMYLKNNGTLEISGSSDNLMKFSGLDGDLKSFVTELNTKLVTAFTALGGSWPGISIDIGSSKIDNIKTGL